MTIPVAGSWLVCWAAHCRGARQEGWLWTFFPVHQCQVEVRRGRASDASFIVVALNLFCLFQFPTDHCVLKAT